MRRSSLILIAASAAAAVGFSVLDADAQTQAPAQPAAAVLAEMQNRESLRPAAAFMTIADRKARSVALFQEAGKVIAHPRCANCHPVDRPAQGDLRRLHQPAVFRGETGDHGEGHGLKALPCAACHTDRNVWVGGRSIVTIPGNPKWALAPREQAWQGKSLGEICRQLKDPARNGGKTLAQIHDHMAHDELVAWGWNPGAGRTPAPGTQAQLGDLIQAWIDTGAECPAEGGPVIPTRDPAAVAD